MVATVYFIAHSGQWLTNFNEPMGAPAIFGKQTEIKLSPPASTLKSRIQV
ncbi:MAG: hypothetical protein P8X79_03125 [Reinekea sp.]